MNKKQSSIIKKLWKAIRYLFYAFAFFSLFLFIFSFTSGPFWIYYWLGTGNSDYNFTPDYIVVLGGGGMPSESGLMRTYYAARLADFYENTDVIICHPGDTSDKNTSVMMMRNELLERGIDTLRVNIVNRGTNTRAQSLGLLKEYSFLADRNILLVTSPEHMYRAVMTFRKAGFHHIGGVPAFSRAIETDIFFDDDKLGGNKSIPGVGENIQIRYQFWNHIKYEIMILREFFAITYYKLKGWA